MNAIAQMPQELAELVSDGESSQIETRSAFKLLTKARADPSLRAALDSQFRKRSKKIQHTVYSIPKAAVGLSETNFLTFCENGAQAVHERGGGGFHYVHILTYSTRTKNRSKEGSAGKEYVRKCISWWKLNQQKKKKQQQ